MGLDGTSTDIADLLQSCIDKKSLCGGKLLHGRILRLNLLSNTFLLNRLIELYGKCANINSALNVFDQMPHRDVYSWNAALGAHCKAGDLQRARHVFDRMPERNIVSWNNVITALTKHGFEEQALGVYERMILEGFVPTRFTLASAFSACSSLLDTECGRRCHGVAVKTGLDKNMYVANALLGMYAKCGLPCDGVRAFGDIVDPNEVSFTAIMGGLAQSERVEEALEMFRLMCRKGIGVDSVSLSSVLGICTRELFEDSTQGTKVSCRHHGQQLHGMSIKLGFEKDLHVSNSLLGMYAKNGDMDSAETIFFDLPEMSVVSWNVMIAGYGHKCQSDKAVLFLQKMQNYGFEPDEVTYINMLAACNKSGDVETAREIFDTMSMPTLLSWNAMLSAYFQSGNNAEAIKLFRKMQFLCVLPDRTTFSIILGSCAGMGLLDYGRQVHALSLKGTFLGNVYVTSGLISMYSKCGRIELAKLIFYDVMEPDIVCWNSTMAGLAFNSHDLEAFEFFRQMRQKEMLPSEFSYTTILSCCCNMSSSFHGKQIHSQIAKDGYTSDIFVGSALINMYCKCGDVDDARRFFDTMALRNTVTWNEMIHGCAQDGRGSDALLLYSDMIFSDEKPDSITFIAVLTACSHAGRIDEAIQIFNSMKQEHGVEPLLDHYTCVIDALGRAGLFTEAEKFLQKIPSKDDPIVWEVLLSSCRVHGNASLAKRAADELLRLDPQNSAPYVLLGNIYASLGRWEEARAVRELMNTNQVGKNPGYSWIDLQNGKQTLLEDDPETAYSNRRANM